MNKLAGKVAVVTGASKGIAAFVPVLVRQLQLQQRLISCGCDCMDGFPVHAIAPSKRGFFIIYGRRGKILWMLEQKLMSNNTNSEYLNI
jgi:hypothetical protein